MKRSLVGCLAALLLALPLKTQAGAGPDLTGQWPEGGVTQTCKGTGAKMRCRVKGTFAVSNKGDVPFPAFSIGFAIQGVPDANVIKPVKSLKLGHGRKISVSFKLPPGVSAQGKKLVASFPGNTVTSQAIP